MFFKLKNKVCKILKTDLDLTKTQQIDLLEVYSITKWGSLRNVELLLDSISSESITDIDEATLLLNIMDNFDHRIRKPLKTKIIDLME